MRTFQKVQIAAALVACATFVFPLRELAAAPPATTVPAVGSANVAQVHDVALDPMGTLTGQVFDGQGRLLVAEPVEVAQNGQVVVVTKTDQQGRFAVSGLRGGLYHVSSNGHASICRAWAANTAPPAANSQLLLTSTDDVQRGQRPAVDLLHPVLIGLIIAAAIAIPIALHKDKKSAS